MRLKTNFKALLIASLICLVSLLAHSQSQPGSSISNIKSETIRLTTFQDYPVNDEYKPLKYVLVSNTDYDAVEIRLENAMKNPLTLSGQIIVEMTCDDTAYLVYDGVIDSSASGTTLLFDIYPDRTPILRDRVVRLNSNVNQCTLHFWDPVLPARKGGLRITKDAFIFPFLKPLNQWKEDCFFPDPKNSQALSLLFLSNQYRNMTCPNTAEEVTALETAEAGFKEKIVSLLGQEISDKFIQAANPYAYLDFSKTPRLDAIFISTLVFRNDFSGALIARLLKFHADRGTLVYILTSDYRQTEKDRTLLRGLVALNGNFRLQSYQYNALGPIYKKPIDYVNEFRRDMHLNAFVTLSKSNPENSTVIAGGRSIHDGFLFKTPPDLSKFPTMIQNGEEKEAPFQHWTDFELKVRGEITAKALFAQLLTFWNRDSKTQDINLIDIKDRQTSTPVPNLETGNLSLRHFVSIPFKDNLALERLYVDMIDRAQYSIKISSPYLRPTTAISDALTRALARNIEITIDTHLELAGDELDWLYSHDSKDHPGKFKDSLKIYTWTGNSVLHAKFILVDGKLAFVGSANISRRSFSHDIENGFLIYNQAFIANLEKTFEGYIQESRRVYKHQKQSILSGIWMSLFQNEF